MGCTLPYVHEYRDRHGKLRRYYRRGGRRIALPGEPGSLEFMRAYEAAAAGGAESGSRRVEPRSIAALCIEYYHSSAFLNLRSSSKQVKRRLCENFRADYGDKPVKGIERKHVQAIIAQKVGEGKPEAANSRLKVLRALMQLAVELGWRQDDPTAGIKKVRSNTPGFHTWTEEDIAAFEAHWPIGTRARLAMALMLFTAQRRGDAVRMGRQHISSGTIRVRQQKTGTEMWIPIHPELQQILDNAPRNHLTLLTTQAGAPFSAAGFGNWFREVCTKAGLRHCSSHGLRKAAARRMAEAGCSAHQIMAITGHQTLAEVERYTAAVDQQALARKAMHALGTPVEDTERAKSG